MFYRFDRHLSDASLLKKIEREKERERERKMPCYLDITKVYLIDHLEQQGNGQAKYLFGRKRMENFCLNDT